MRRFTRVKLLLRRVLRLLQRPSRSFSCGDTPFFGLCYGHAEIREEPFYRKTDASEFAVSVLSENAHSGYSFRPRFIIFNPARGKFIHCREASTLSSIFVEILFASLSYVLLFQNDTFIHFLDKAFTSL